MTPSRPTSTQPTTDTLKSVLRLERARGFQDTAVMGGLDRLLQRLSQSMEGAPLLGRLSQHGVLAVSYREMAPVQREAWVREVERLLSSPSAPPAREAPRPSAARRRARPQPPQASLDAPLAALRVRADVAARLRRRLRVETVRDLLYLFPNRHIDFSQVRRVSELQAGQQQTAEVTVWEAKEVKLGRGGRMKATEATVGDETGNIRVVWFNQPYLARAFQANTRLVLSGRVSLFQGRRVFESPEYEVVKEDGEQQRVHTGRLVPVYPAPEGLSPRTVRRAVWAALDVGLDLVEDPLPDDVRRRVGLLELPRALRLAHYPESEAAREDARRRLAFDEFLVQQLSVLRRRHVVQETARPVPLSVDRAVLGAFLRSLPFTLTEAQSRALEEILADMERRDRPMSRLLQGDVGSGKTVVALAALLVAATNGRQGAIMVPTEVLAEQHFLNIVALLGGLARPARDGNWVSVYLDPFPRPICVALLTGSLGQDEKEETRRRLAEGTVDILVGTHALIQSGVEVPRLALAVVDEQHRFGVLQRATLRQKGEAPHLLAMSATPIPRTLALTLYGDLDISTLDQLPPGRQPIVTRQVPPEKRDAAYDFVRQQVGLGRQAFVICPLIQESEAVQARAAVEVHHRLATEVYPDLRLGLLHGRLGIREKQAVMEAFRGGRVDILVATPVVEVGVDVPNATVMLIEGADRFGLSQLHQLRGRVGRGVHKSYCLLLVESPSEEASERLQALERHTDGFALAEVDLHLRGPGDFFGTRQSGLPDLRMARLSDRDLLASAREEASRLLERDPRLGHHPGLRRSLRQYLGDAVEEWS